MKKKALSMQALQQTVDDAGLRMAVLPGPASGDSLTQCYETNEKEEYLHVSDIIMLAMPVMKL